MNDTPSDRRLRIAAAFGAAERYEEAAAVQRIVAAELAARIAAAGVARNSRVLELGCGTGFLTAASSAAIGPARWTVSDIAPAMVDRARRALALDADYRIVDGEAVDPALGRFDLIASNLAFQWFADLPRAVTALAGRLEPGGLLAFSTMAANGFPEWTAALAGEGLRPGTPAYAGREELAALAPPGFRADVTLVEIVRPQRDARDFLRELKTIGAGTPAEDYRPAPAAALRRAMARFDAGPRIVTWRLAYCLFRRD